MSLKQKLLSVFSQAQHPEHCHKKLLKIVENLFQVAELESFTSIYTLGLLTIFNKQCADQNPFVARGLEFLAQLGIKITLKCVEPIEAPNADGSVTRVYDVSDDPFFNNILKSSLKVACKNKENLIFNACYFITLLLNNIGNNVEIDNRLCESILETLVQILNNQRWKLRLQAVKALIKLQEPGNPDCIVMNSFLTMASDTNAEIRKTIVESIAPQQQSFIKIKERLLDTDVRVRQAAYGRFADINPRVSLKITDRNFILSLAFEDCDEKIEQILSEKLLPKWLNFYEGNYLNFLKGLKLDADENDTTKFANLCSKVVNNFLNKNPLSEMIDSIPIDKNEKLIPIKQLNLESVLYWSNIIAFLRKSEDRVEYLDSILPELTTFSNYIERIIKEKSSVTMDEWENLTFQNIVYELFQIASGYDFSDEVGRKTFYSRILQIITNYRFQQKVLNEIISVATLLNTNIDVFTMDMCQVISDIREPLVDEVPTEQQMIQHNYEVAVLKLRIHELEITEEEAVKKRDFELAKISVNEIEETQRKLKKLMEKAPNEKVRISKDDPETLCKCLDILNGVLKLKNIETLSPALRVCKDEFLIPLLNNNTSEVHWRFIRSLGLCSIVDKETALKHATFFCLPIATYSTVLKYDRAALKQSIACLTDLICVHGLSVVGMDEDAGSITSQEQKNSKRKLYSEDMQHSRIVRTQDLNIEYIIDINLDMLEDEDENVRHTAVRALLKLMVNSFLDDPELMTRLLLKWFNPSTETRDGVLQQHIGVALQCFISEVKEARKIIEKSILLVISTLAKAPASSPLIKIDIDNVLRFLSALTNVTNDNNPENSDSNLVSSILERISNQPSDVCVPYLTKFLSYLNVNCNDPNVWKNIISSAEFILPDLEIGSRRNLTKFLKSVRGNPSICQHQTTVDETQTSRDVSERTGDINATGSEAVVPQLSSVEDRPDAKKRRLLHQSRTDKKNGEKGNSSNESNSDEDIERSKRNEAKNNKQKIDSNANHTKTQLDEIQEVDTSIEENAVVPTTPVNDVFVKCDYTHLKSNEKKSKPNGAKNNIKVISQVVLKNPTNSKENAKSSSSDQKNDSPCTRSRSSNIILIKSPRVRLERSNERPKALAVMITPLRDSAQPSTSKQSDIDQRKMLKSKESSMRLPVKRIVTPTRRALRKRRSTPIIRKTPLKLPRLLDSVSKSSISSSRMRKNDSTPTKKRQPETPVTEMKTKPNKKAKTSDVLNTSSRSLRSQSRRTRSETTPSKKTEKRSRRDLKFTPKQAGRISRTQNLRRSIQLLKINRRLDDKSDDDNESSSSNDESDTNNKKQKETQRDTKKGQKSTPTSKNLQESSNDKEGDKRSSKKESNEIRKSNRRSARKNDLEQQRETDKEKKETRNTEVAESKTVSRTNQKLKKDSKKVGNVPSPGTSKNDTNSQETRTSERNKKKQQKDADNSNIESKPKNKENDTNRGNGVLKSLNGTLNKINASPKFTKTVLNSSIRTRSGTKSNGNISLNERSTPNESITTSRRSHNTSKNNTSRQLNFSSASEQTILRTFLQGDEMYQNMDELTIEDASSVSNSSNDSKKENFNISSTTCSSSEGIRTITTRKSKATSRNSDSEPQKKHSKTERRTNLGAVARNK